MSDAELRRRELATQLFGHIESQLALGESRASVLLAANALLAAAGATLLKAEGAFAGLSGIAWVLLVAAALALGLSILLALWAIFPALAATRFGAPPREDLLFFGSIARMDAEVFAERFAATGPEQLDSYMLRSIHGKACKARQKFTVLFCAALSTGLSLLLFGLAVVLAS